ncbi:MAG TPA: hypothetical protein VJ841_02290 [Candidatus Saccharimonadales bacterium]|nr:hypothetical protein [Candidatus Saccharimonadales bacterium]
MSAANLSKGENGAVIPEGAGSGILPIVDADYRVVLSWRVESGGNPFKRVDLDALAMTANASKVWVGACHKKDKRPFNGAFRHGGDTKARPGQMASETIYFNLAKMVEDPDVVHNVFSITCFGNRMALAELAELRVQLFSPDNQPILPGGRRGIEDPASAALAFYVNGKTGAFQEVSNTYNVDGSAQKWRDLAAAAKGILPAA